MNKNLKAAIIRIYGTQYRFARAIDAQETFVSSVVRGQRELTTDDKRQWAKILKCKPAEIFPEAA